MVVDAGPGIARAGINLVGTIEADGFARKIRGAAPWHARAALAVFTVAHVDHDRLGRDDDAEVATQASGGSRHIRCLPLIAGAIGPAEVRQSSPDDTTEMTSRFGIQAACPITFDGRDFS